MSDLSDAVAQTRLEEMRRAVDTGEVDRHHDLIRQLDDGLATVGRRQRRIHRAEDRVETLGTEQVEDIAPRGRRPPGEGPEKDAVEEARQEEHLR